MVLVLVRLRRSDPPLPPQFFPILSEPSANAKLFQPQFDIGCAEA